MTKLILEKQILESKYYLNWKAFEEFMLMMFQNWEWIWFNKNDKLLFILKCFDTLFAHENICCLIDQK
jgi:hypothetical protein